MGGLDLDGYSLDFFPIVLFGKNLESAYYVLGVVGGQLCYLASQHS